MKDRASSDIVAVSAFVAATSVFLLASKQTASTSFPTGETTQSETNKAHASKQRSLHNTTSSTQQQIHCETQSTRIIETQTTEEVPIIPTITICHDHTDHEYTSKSSSPGSISSFNAVVAPESSQPSNNTLSLDTPTSTLTSTENETTSTASSPHSVESAIPSSPSAQPAFSTLDKGDDIIFKPANTVATMRAMRTLLAISTTWAFLVTMYSFAPQQQQQQQQQPVTLNTYSVTPVDLQYKQLVPVGVKDLSLASECPWQNQPFEPTEMEIFDPSNLPVEDDTPDTYTVEWQSLPFNFSGKLPVQEEASETYTVEWQSLPFNFIGKR